ncbi:MAG: DUF5668 domain-containing protein [Thermodesulfobacteriota bacterium]
MKSKSKVGAYILILLGVVFLLSNYGWLPSVHSLLAKGWPIILIVAGGLLLIRR